MTATDPAPDAWAGPDDALFEREGDTFVPTIFSQGPWDPGQLHGGAVSALVASGLDAVPSPVPMRVARLTLDLVRGVPMRPLRCATTVMREGRRVQLVHLELLDGEEVCVRAAALRIREDAAARVPTDVASAPEPAIATGPVGAAGIPEGALDRVPGFIRAIEFRRVRRARREDPVEIWTRLRCPVVAGTPLSPLARLAASADLVSGTAAGLDYERWLFINPDLTIHVRREPRGEWIGAQDWAHLEADGIGQCQALVHDGEGPIARVQASMLVERRATREETP